MVAQVTVETAALQRRLEFLYRRLKRPREANRAAATQIYGWIIRNYDSEGAQVGGWLPVAEATRRRKEQAGKEKLLVMSGLLRSSLLPFYDDSDAGVGSEVIYSEVHQKGSAEHNIPARPFLPDQRTALEIGLNVYGLYVQREIARQGLA